MNIRGAFTVKGVVQSVNFRETVLRIAIGAGLKGFVRNQDDGTVRVVAEGPRCTVRALPSLLRIRSARIFVEKVLARYSRATGEFRSFIIDYGPDVAPGDLALIEKMDEGYHIMREMSERLDQTNRSIGGLDDHLSADLRNVGKNVTSMDKNTGRRFDRLDRTYGRFGRTLKTVSKDMKGMNSSLKTVSKDMKGMKRSMSSMASDTRALRRAAAPGRRRPGKRAAAAV